MNLGNDPFFPEGLPQPLHRLPMSAGDVPSRGVSNPNASAQSSLPEPLAILRAFRQNWLLGVTLGLMAAGIAGGGAWKLLPKSKFTATNKIQIKSLKPILLLETAQGKIDDLKSFQEQQIAFINSPAVLEAALKMPGIADLPSVKSQDDPAEWLESQFLASFPRGGEVMDVEITGHRKADLVPLVNAVTDAYLQEIVNKDENFRLKNVKELQKLYDEGEKELKERRDEVRRLAETVGSDDKSILALQHSAIIEALKTYREDKVRCGSDRQQFASELAVLNDQVTETKRPVDPDEIEAFLDDDPEIRQLRLDISKAKNQVESNIKRSRGNDPAIRKARENRDIAQKAFNSLRKELIPKFEARIRAREDALSLKRINELQSKIRALENYDKELDDNIARLENEAKNFNSRALDLDAMKNAIAVKEQTNQRIAQQLDALRIETKAPQRVDTIGRAKSAKTENPFKRLAAIGIVAASAFLAMIFLVCWREYRLRKVDTPKEVVDGLGLRLVGTLPKLPGRELSRSNSGPDPARWQNLLIESIDAARTVLLRDSRHSTLRTIMVTSASKGEGKSSLSSHLAISLARTGKRTLLADFDLRSPSTHHLFEIPKGPGTAELLRGEETVEQVVQHVMTDLDVLPAGFCDAEAIRALGQDALPNLLQSLTEQYDFVVIDTAPVLPVADALLISGHVDAVILSVYREVSRMPAVTACKERLESLGVRLLGVVVTGIPVERFGPEYSYAARPETFA